MAEEGEKNLGAKKTHLFEINILFNEEENWVTEEEGKELIF